MKGYKIFLVSFGFMLVILYSFFRIKLDLDLLPILIYFILGIPILAIFLESAILFGSEFI